MVDYDFVYDRTDAFVVEIEGVIMELRYIINGILMLAGLISFILSIIKTLKGKRGWM